MVKRSGVVAVGLMAALVCLPAATARDAAAQDASEAAVRMAQAKEPAKKKPAKKAAGKRAPAKKAAANNEPGWSVRCDNEGQGLVCKAVQTVLLAKTRQRLISVSISKPGKGKKAPMLLQLPHGLFNPAGVTVRVDKAKPQKLEIQTCDANGCYAGTTLTPDVLAAMSKGGRLGVVFQDLKKQNITVPVSLKGFGEAFKKL
jgi:invasion protein IalB